MASVTLSFDNGPEPEVTPLVLDILRRRGLRATFFVIGRKLADPARRALAERAHAEGHWIGNHTLTHSLPLGEGDAAHATREIVETQAALGGLSHPDRLFRPMGGGGRLGPHLLSPAALRLLEEGAYTCVLWNVLPGDWRDPEGWPALALSQCAGPEPKLIVLHDLPTGAMRHLDRTLDQLEEAGHRFVQEMPENCLPLRRGVPTGPLAPYVAAPA